jgi:peptide/nickel transport system permease protein
MLALLTRRLIAALLTLIAAAAIIFVVLEVLPGDAAAVMLGVEARPETLVALRAELGLDRPAPERFVRWLVGLVTGELGLSYTYRVPVTSLIAERLAVTVPLALIAAALAVVIALPAGVLAASRHDRPADVTIMVASQIGLALPNFWFALLLVLLFSIGLGWLPSGGFPGWSAGIGAGLLALILPAVSLALPQAAILARITRSAILDQAQEDYTRTARAKGLSRDATLWRHVLRNALIPVVTILGLQFSFLLAGAIIIENVFYLPGLGRLVFQAIAQRDLIVVKDVVMLLAALVVALNLAVDIAYLVIDPRLRVRAS